jgi:hypothetical protein
VSCVHLRNMSHVSLGCLSLLLHTCIDKALVPVNRCGRACVLTATNNIMHRTYDDDVFYLFLQKQKN